MSWPTLDLRGADRDGEALRSALAPALDHLRSDGVLAYPTETVYGFGGRISPAAVDRLVRLKGRDPSRPFLLIVANPEAVPGLVWTDEARELASVFWPGALTLVLADPERRYPVGVRGPEGGVAVRHTAHPVARALVEALGEPLTSTSANAPGQAPAAAGADVPAALERLEADPGSVLILDVGRLPPSPPSTLVDCTGSTPHVLREGAVPAHRLRCVLPDLPDRA